MRKRAEADDEQQAGQPGARAPEMKHIAAGGVGVVAFLLLTWLAWQAWIHPRVTCAGLRGVCDEVAPPHQYGSAVPADPLAGQTKPKDGACPWGFTVINGGCWTQLVKLPPCPVQTYEHGGKCWTPLMQPPARIPNAAE